MIHDDARAPGGLLADLPLRMGCEHRRTPLSWGGMSFRLLMFALAGMLVCVRTLAYASPPDPSWIGGFWDDDDYDDVVFHITSFSADETAPARALRPHWTPVWIVPPDDEQLAPSPAISPQHPRGPPSPETPW